MTYPASVRSSLRAALGAVLTTIVVLSLPVSAFAAPAATTATGSAVADEVPGRAAAKAILADVVDALSPKAPLSATEAATAPERGDLSLMLRDLREALPVLTPSEQATARQYLAKPAVGENCTGANVIASAHFCVHYTTNFLSADRATEAQAQLTSDTFEFVYSKIVNGLKYRAPLNDGDGLLDVYLTDLSSKRQYGFCQTTTASRTSAAFCGVDNDFDPADYGGAPAINSLRVTAAHEFFHAVQFAYDAGDSDWFLEGTATWMEEQIYPNINDYLQYVPDSQVQRPLRSTDSTAGFSVYGSVIFWKFLSERFRDPNIVRQVWNAAAVSTGTRNGLQSVAMVLRARKTTLPLEFARYGVWNTLPAGSYSDRGRFPIANTSTCRGSRWCPWASGTLGRSRSNTGSLAVRINHLATAPLILRPGSSLRSKSKLTVSVNAPNTSRGSQARIQVRFKNGKVAFYTVRLNSQGNGAKKVSFNPKTQSSVIVTLSNGSGSLNNQLFKVRGKVSY